MKSSRSRPLRDRQAPHSTVHSIMMEKVEGEPSEKGVGRQQGLYLFSDGLFDDPRAIFVGKDREGSERTPDFDGLNTKDLVQNGELLKGNLTSQSHSHPINPTDRALWDSIGTEKIISDKGNPLDHFPKSFQPDFLKDHYFTLKKQTSIFHGNLS